MNKPDLHTQFAAEIFRVPITQVTPAMRAYAKRVRYVQNYSTPVTLHAALHTQLAIAKAKVPR